MPINHRCAIPKRTHCPRLWMRRHLLFAIVRENVRLPVYKVREMNGYGLNWLSRQSGRTIREKISSAGNSVMAVQRRMSLDTGENRLFVAFAGAIAELLQYKADNHVPCRDMERDYADMAAAFLHGSEIGEIRKWENLAPNNTLLSDQNYKKIWYGWNGIKKLDDRIKDDMEHIDTRLDTGFTRGPGSCTAWTTNAGNWHFGRKRTVSARRAQVWKSVL